MNEYIITIEICFAVHRALPSAGLGGGEGSPGLAALKQFYSVGFLKEIIDLAEAQITDTSVGIIFFLSGSFQQQVTSRSKTQERAFFH